MATPPLIEKGIEWHTLDLEAVFRKLESEPAGLSSAAVGERQRAYGANSLPTRKLPSFFVIFLHQFLNPLVYILIFAGTIALLLSHFVDAVFVFAVIMVNSLVGAWQENKAEKSALALQGLLKVSNLVRRHGQEKMIEAEELVPGDIVFLTTGNKVPADLRLFEAANLAVDEAFLTGESFAVNKRCGIVPAAAPLSERANLVYAGATVMSGRAWGVVVETGRRTEVGKIADVIASAPTPKPPLIIRMEQFTKRLSFIILFLCLALAIVALGRNLGPLEVFFLITALAVSAIPEGLPVSLTVALSVATVRMSRRQVIVRKLTAVEALGSCTIIASDKTGTLTLNQQTAKYIYLSSGTGLEVSGQGYNGKGEIAGREDLSADDQAILEASVRAVVLANEAKLWRRQSVWHNFGDSMDVAFLALAYKAGWQPAEIKNSVVSLLDIPYESERRFAAHIYQAGAETMIAVKGSVDKILDFCGQSGLGSGAASLDKEAVRAKGIELAAQGFRVLAVAGGPLNVPVPAEPAGFRAEEVKGLSFLSLVCFVDPLRAESRQAIETCRRAGIEVAMITGDHPATALFIARELGIAQTPAELVTGHQIGDEEVTPEFMELVGKTRVFAGVSPLQKVKIVKALKQLGHFVGVTGDGVNDAPALKQAHIGVAMGSGTDVAKEMALMIVADDNFASIVGGIEEGRFAYANVRKVVYFLISSGAAEIFLFILAIFAGLPLPLFAAQLLWLNVITNGIQDIALSFEAGEKGVMENKPRPPAEGIFNRLMTRQTVISGLVIGLVSFGIWFYLINVAGW